MDGEKMAAAREALNSFLAQLQRSGGRSVPVPIRQAIRCSSRDGRATSGGSAWSSGGMQPRGGTALYDAVAEAIPLAQSGHNRKKALVIISDGNDTSSRTDVSSLKRMIRETEVLVYAIGIDSQTRLRRIPSGRSAYRSSSGAARIADAVSVSRCRAAATQSAAAATADVSAAHPRRQQSRHRRRPGERRGAARDHRRQRRPHRDRPKRARSRSGDRRHRRRVEPAVLPRVRGDRRRKMAGGTRSASSCAIRTYHVRARRGFVATP